MQLPLSLLIILSHGARLIHSVSLADDCTQWFSDVDTAVTEARDMASFAQTRWESFSPPWPGSLLQDMLGAGTEDDSDILQVAVGWYSKAVRAAEDPKTLIHCTDTHLNPIGTTGTFVDNGLRVTTGQQNNACGGALRGFMYPGHDGPIIVLCSDSANGALRAYKEAVVINGWNMQGDMRLVPFGVNYLAGFLSYMILHELMHAADSLQFPAKLPSGRNEAYGFDAIVGHAPGGVGGTGLAAADKQRNADSYALLGCGWWVYRYYWDNGIAQLARRTQRPSNAPPTSGLKI